MAPGVRLGRGLIDGADVLVVGHDAGVNRLDELVEGPAPSSLIDVIAGWDGLGPALAAAAATATPSVDERELQWLPPYVPPKLLCIGANYGAHNAEMLGEVVNQFPYTFLKPSGTAVAAHRGTVPLPDYAEKVDFEAELAVIIGRDGQIFGYSIVNDLSVRDWVPGVPILGIDWVVGKGFDGSAPFGPWVVPAASVPDPQALTIRLWVNEELRQNGNTSNMVFSIEDCVSHLQRVMTLEVGDVIATGTPEGVGMGDGRYLTAGDNIRIEIESVGVQETTIAAALGKETKL